ncbi:hypothetical protein DOM21_19055 [Bacteriovorax stolpii]|uniref:hypothetical protein n=1 Tax=Bacteriovorax stolpii TaxID=960 RepID=UPI00115C43FD|nr:hypothetical protein [Bacteriovorax stolpii]QDK43516.1 hypothetical protein DOM21_19055 [Bacteriovorax stolpii]
MIIAWPTHNRSKSVLRSVKSFKNTNLKLNFFVSNTGESELTPLFNSEHIEAELWEGEARYKWINLLKENCRRAHINPSLIDFALNPSAPKGVITTGANRNFLLLKLVGKKFVSVDDDVVFEPRRLAPVEIGNALGPSPGNPLSTLYFKDQQSLNLLKEKSERLKDEEFLSTQIQMLSFVQNSQFCALSLCGYYGDSGFQSPRGILSLNEQSIHELIKKDQFHAALKSRLVWRVSDKVQAFKYSPAMLMCAGFSNDYELPPFFPMGRNQDSAYAYALSACLSNALIGHLSFAIMHAPVEIRNYTEDLPDLEMRMNDIMVLLWIEFLKKNIEKNYKNAGEFFLEFAQEKNFTERLNFLISQHFSERALRLEEKIKNLQSKDNDFFQNWIKLAVQEKALIDKALQKSPNLLPMETNNSLLAADWIGQYAELLLSWKEIRNIAQGI